MGFFRKIKTAFNKNKDTVFYEEKLEKSRNNMAGSLNNLKIKHKVINDDYFDDLEELLISADVGVNTVFKFLEKIKSRIKEERITNVSDLTEIIIDELFLIYVGNDILTDKINVQEEGPTVILVVGVNGVGKTTSIAKIASRYKKENKKVLLVAGDTFRAGAVEQLKEWGEKVGVDFYGSENKDPASVVYDGLNYAKENKIDIVLIDTAGRLENKINLMNELEKINKIIRKFIPSAPHETLLVIDATTGQNGILQAKSFKSITDITGVILTKLDGTAKGGIVLAIKDETNLPVKFVGLGEKEEDLKPFDIESYIYSLFKGVIDG